MDAATAPAIVYCYFPRFMLQKLVYFADSGQ